MDLNKIINEEINRLFEKSRQLSHNSIKQIIYKAKSFIKNEGVGDYGPIGNDDFFDKSKFNNEIEKIQDLWYNYDGDDNEDEASIGKRLTPQLFSIWQNYYNAMSRKRNGSELPFFSFVLYLSNDNVFMYKYNNTYIIGQFGNGFFKPSHFSPSSIREGYDALRELIHYSNIVFAVTSDLYEMLDKMGAYSNKKLIFPMLFRENIVMKNVVVTSPDVLAEILANSDSGNFDSLMNMNFNDIVDYNDKYKKYNYDDQYDSYYNVKLKGKQKMNVNQSLFESEIEIPEIPNTMNFFHGGNLDSIDDFFSQKKGRYEYGPGLYLTTHYETAIKYAKGSRKLYLVVVENGLDSNDAYIDFDATVKFVKAYAVAKYKNNIIQRLSDKNKNGKIPAFMLINLLINYEALSPKNTIHLMKFLVENGVDYSIVHNAFGWHEKMLVLYNMRKIVKIIPIAGKNRLKSYPNNLW